MKRLCFVAMLLLMLGGCVSLGGSGGGVMHEKGDGDEAVVGGEIIECGVMGMPSVGPSQEYFGIQAERAGDLEKARVHYTRWLQAKPSDEGVWYSLARVLMGMGDVDGAMVAWERAGEAGFKDIGRIDGDGFWEKVKEDERFVKGIAKVKENRGKETTEGMVREFLKQERLGTYVVLLPEDYEAEAEKRYSVCVILHGSDLNEKRYLRVADKLGRDDVIYVLPRGPFVTENSFRYGQEGYTGWPTYRLGESWGKVERAKFHAKWVMDCVEDVKEKYRVKDEKVCLLGHSMGGAFAYMTASIYPEQVRSVFCYAGYYFEEFTSDEAMSELRNEDVSVWLAHGEKDQVVGKEFAVELQGRLESWGIENGLWLLDCGHRVEEVVYEPMEKWLDEVVRGEK
ncbi:alpha/beta fold hydrolase [Planctomycetota bacterium]|nr:alpha/beta fold hydrolase [Planctomycetota bacterium]